MKLLTYIPTLFLLVAGCVYGQQPERLIYESESFDNLFALNDSIYRSEQPSRKAFKELEDYGFKTVINFRRLWSDDKKARDTDLTLIHLPMRTSKLTETETETEVVEALKLIDTAQKPLLLHCWHGSDRTGIVVAAYRMVFEDWSKEDAIAEFRRADFGYHENWYPHLLGILNNLDIKNVKQQLNKE